LQSRNATDAPVCPRLYLLIEDVAVPPDRHVAALRRIIPDQRTGGRRESKSRRSDPGHNFGAHWLAFEGSALRPRYLRSAASSARGPMESFGFSLSTNGTLGAAITLTG
jgi:hypothetical protein